jgi:hypothetical protein
MEDPTKKNGNGKANGNGKGNGKAPEESKLPEETKQEIAEQQAGAEKAHAKGKAGKKNEKGEKKGKGKFVAFEAKPVPEAVRPLVAEIEKVKDLENLKAVARSLQRHFKKVYLDACKKAVDGLKAGNVVWFKKGAKLIEGKVVKVKTSGKVKIDVEGKTWRVPGTIVHKGKPTGADRAEATGSKVTKKAA